jgi:ABC-type uncharacterized transport system permease subunit
MDDEMVRSEARSIQERAAKTVVHFNRCDLLGLGCMFRPLQQAPVSYAHTLATTSYEWKMLEGTVHAEVGPGCAGFAKVVGTGITWCKLKACPSLFFAMQTTFFVLAALLYAACAFLPSRQGFAISLGTALGWLLHGAALGADVIEPGALRIGFAVMLSAALWISVGAYWLENRNFSLDGLRVLVLPSAAVAVILPVVFPGTLVPLAGKSSLYSWHIAIAILAYSTLTIAAFHAVLMALQESKLHTRPTAAKRGWLAAAIDRLPALLTMEKLLFRLIAFGFALLTLTVLSGVVFSEQLFHTAFKWDHKTIFTMLSWGLFGLLLAGRYWRGWRGKTALSFTLSGFATLLLAYVGSRFVLEVVLHRGLA